MMKKRTTRTTRGMKRRRQQQKRAIILLGISFVCILIVVFLCKKLFFSTAKDETVQLVSDEADLYGAPPLDVQLLTVNEYSRPQIALDKVKGIVVHYIANPGTSAQDNRNYFENLKDAQTTKASSHFVIGLEGEIIQCIPSSEISYASNDRNSDTISIECCHPDESGEFNQATYQSLVQLTGYLCHRFKLTSDEVIRHYDVTGKICPKYFVENEDEWKQFRKDVDAAVKALS